MVDITILTLREENLKQKAARIEKEKRKLHREKFLVPMGSGDYLKIIEDQGHKLVYNPPGNETASLQLWHIILVQWES